jgi:PKD repeat protein
MTIDATSGLITWTPVASGDFPVTVVASNPAGSDSQSFTLTVNQPAFPPVITSSPLTQAVVGVAYIYDVEASGDPAPAFSLSTFPSGMTIDATSGLISWTPSNAGNFDVSVLASNTAGNDTQSFTISVQPAPSLPVITSTPGIMATVGQDYLYDVEASGDPAPSFSLTASPPGMVIDSNTGLIQWTPTASGDFPVTVVATNPAGSDSQSFTLTVSQPTSPPVITSSPVMQAIVGQAYAYDVEASGSPAPTRPSPSQPPHPA